MIPHASAIVRADWLFPMSGPPICDGAVAFAGDRIIAVGPARDLLLQFPGSPIHEFGASTILPGLVNAHVHLELSDLHCADFAGGDFAAWLCQVIGRTSQSPDPAARIARAIEIGIGECLAFGITAVGDISRFPSLTRPLLALTPINVVSYGEVLAMAARRHLLAERLDAAADRRHERHRLHVGISPHAPYSVEMQGYRTCAAMAREHGLPLMTHLAESPYEAEFLACHTGPFRALWDQLGGWDNTVPHFEGGPIRFAQAAGLIDHPTALVHVNYADDGELEILARGHASVIFCPRTHAFFGHPPHRWRDMLARGINVAVGTDSRASSLDLNIVDDLRLLHRLAPEIPVQKIWELATIRAARALNGEERVGSLSPGKQADCVVFPITGEEPLCQILESRAMPSAIWLAGGRVESAVEQQK